MNIFSKIIKKLNNLDKQTSTTGSSDCRFAFGVEDYYKVKDTNNMLVIGQVRGTVKLNTPVVINNFGVDEEYKINTKILHIEFMEGSYEEITDKQVSLILEGVGDKPLRVGSIIHTEGIEFTEIYNAYISAIGDTYVLLKDMVLSQEDFDKMTITDLARMIDLFLFKVNKLAAPDEPKREKYKELLDKAYRVLSDRILASEKIYAIFNKNTGEPHLFSETVARDDGSYECTPPDIMLLTEAHVRFYNTMAQNPDFELKEILKGSDNGIYNFLGSSFYLDGACGVRINNCNFAIDASMLVKKPNYENIPPSDIPITNPDLVRWLLLIGQMPKDETEDSSLIKGLYYNFLQMQLPDAKFLVPMKTTDGELKENGDCTATLKKNISFVLATGKGKNDKDMVQMFTDWKRLHMVFDETWNAMVQPIEGMIDMFDVEINPTQYLAAGCYIDKSFFEAAKEKLNK